MIEAHFKDNGEPRRQGRHDPRRGRDGARRRRRALGGAKYIQLSHIEFERDGESEQPGARMR
jgi:hypothetical protein